jgi:hypothetical protein
MELVTVSSWAWHCKCLRQSKLRAPANNLEKQVKTYKTRENKTEKIQNLSGDVTGSGVKSQEFH